MTEPSRTPESDPAFDALVKRAREGELTAFNALVLRFQDGLYSLTLRMLNDSAAAEDVVVVLSKAVGLVADVLQ